MAKPAAILYPDGRICVRLSSASLRSLAAKGIIEIVEVGGRTSDIVRLI